MTAPSASEVELYLSMLHRALLGAPLLINSDGDPLAVLAHAPTQQRTVEEMVTAIFAARERGDACGDAGSFEDLVGTDCWW